MAEVGVLLHGNMAEMADLECGNMAEGKDTVWIGFMDIVPVIGAVKESVELVLALYEGNKEVIKEKEKALENFVKAPFQKHVKFTQTQYKPAGDAADFSGLVNVKEVPKGKIVEHVKKGSKNQNLTLDQQRARARQLQDIQKRVVEKLNLIGEPFNEELKEELKRSKRGAHVFNNDVLKFHSKVLKDFIKRYRIESLRGYNKQTMDELGKHTLLQKTAADIQYNMVVHFDDDEFYVNDNAILYSVYSKVLHEAFLKVLRHINPDDKTDKEKQQVTDIIDNMNNYQIYVDKFAKEKWIDNNPTRERRFEEVRGEVANMYKEERGLVWCTDIMHEVEPLFNRGQ
ncbi:uncharacterized protein LOC131369327 [Hemibagrus wyckioides]|uniref:uncharacterized protein LOC131369327 n=1 Tax=Hemibagrus wyckioides TaxID=337641 RepID=UPI00266B9C5B|nr:uncharacterized protein LOC131369327 [Hemibagrus wyckioides]